MHLTSDGSAVLITGDYNQDGLIQNTDFDTWFVNPSQLNSYLPADGNLDGVIQVTDFDVWFNNKAKIGIAEIQY